MKRITTPTDDNTAKDDHHMCKIPLDNFLESGVMAVESDDDYERDGFIVDDDAGETSGEEGSGSSTLNAGSDIDLSVPQTERPSSSRASANASRSYESSFRFRR